MNSKRCCLVWLLPLLVLNIVAIARGQASNATIRYDAVSRIFRIDAADVTYVLGVNEKKELQALY
jgi:alpha-galactosidase